MYEKLEESKLFSKIMKKKFQLALFSPLGRWTENTFLFKGGLIDALHEKEVNIRVKRRSLR